MKDKNSQLVKLMRGIRVSVPSDVADDIEKRIESYAATRESEGRDKGVRDFILRSGISSLVGFAMSADGLRPDSQLENWAEKIKTHAVKVQSSIDQALTDTQGDEDDGQLMDDLNDRGMLHGDTQGGESDE